MATPVPATKRDGELFAIFCKNCQEIKKDEYFKYYRNITPYKKETKSSYGKTYNCQSYCCGFGNQVVGLLPNNLYATCNEGFVYCDEDYTKIKDKDEVKSTINKKIDAMNQRLCLNEEQYSTFQKQHSYFYNDNSSFLIGNITSLIVMLALTKQIEDKYSNIEKAAETANCIFDHISICLKDSYNSTGSFSMIPNGLIKLLLNGALEYILE